MVVGVKNNNIFRNPDPHLSIHYGRTAVRP